MAPKKDPVCKVKSPGRMKKKETAMKKGVVDKIDKILMFLDIDDNKPLDQKLWVFVSFDDLSEWPGWLKPDSRIPHDNRSESVALFDRSIGGYRRGCIVARCEEGIPDKDLRRVLGQLKRRHNALTDKRADASPGAALETLVDEFSMDCVYHRYTYPNVSLGDVYKLRSKDAPSWYPHRVSPPDVPRDVEDEGVFAQTTQRIDTSPSPAGPDAQAEAVPDVAAEVEVETRASPTADQDERANTAPAQGSHEVGLGANARDHGRQGVDDGPAPTSTQRPSVTPRQDDEPEAVEVVELDQSARQEDSSGGEASTSQAPIPRHSTPNRGAEESGGKRRRIAVVFPNVSPDNDASGDAPGAAVEGCTDMPTFMREVRGGLRALTRAVARLEDMGTETLMDLEQTKTYAKAAAQNASANQTTLDRALLRLPWSRAAHADGLFEDAEKEAAFKRLLIECVTELNTAPRDFVRTFLHESKKGRVYAAKPSHHEDTEGVYLLGVEYIVLPPAVTHALEDHMETVLHATRAHERLLQHLRRTRTKTKEADRALFNTPEAKRCDMMRLLWRNTELRGVNVIDAPAPLQGTDEQKEAFVAKWKATVNKKFYDVLAKSGQQFKDLQ